MDALPDDSLRFFSAFPCPTAAPGLCQRTELRGCFAPPDYSWGTPFDEALSAMPETHREQVLVLDRASTRRVYDNFNRRDLLCGDDGWGNSPFEDGCYRSVQRYPISYLDAGGGFKRIEAKGLKKWLYRRGIAFADIALLLPVFAPADTAVLAVTWKIVVKYAPQLFSGDNVVVVGESCAWCLYYHHDGLLTYAQEPNSHFAPASD